MDEDGAKLTMEDFGLSDAVLETAESFEAIALSKEKTLTVNVEPAILYHGNEGAIRQLVSLLLDNAMKYSYEKTGMEAGRLPSTSPANAAYQMERLLQSWKVILR